MNSTGFLLGQAIISNGAQNNAWANPNNLLALDGQYADASGGFARVVVGNFPLNIPIGSTIVNITIRFRGYRGSFNTTMKIYAVDNSSGVTISYPYTPDFQSFTGTATTYVLNATLFSHVWTVNEINNIKIGLEADGELHLDGVEVNVDYQPSVVPPPTPTTTGQVVVDEFIQGQRYTSARAFDSSQTFLFVKDFNYPNGQPIQYADAHGAFMITIDQNKETEENCQLSNVEQNYQGTGLCRLTTPLNQRGLDFQSGYASTPSLIRDHISGCEVVISNSAPFYDRFLKKNQIGALVSAPIETEDEGISISTYSRKYNFVGAGVTAQASPAPSGGGDDITVVIPGSGSIVPPSLVFTSSATTGIAQAGSLTWAHTCLGLDRLLVVDVTTEEAQTVTGVTFNGLALTQRSVITDVANNLRVERWFLIAPTSGTFNIVVTMSGLAYITCGARTFTGTDVSAPFDGATGSAIGTSNVPSALVNTLLYGSIVIDGMVTATLPITHTANPGQSLDWQIVLNANRQGSGSDQLTAAPGAFTNGYSISQVTDWAILVDAVAGIPAPGQASIQFEDQGVALGSQGTVDEVDFVGQGVVASRAGNKVTVNVGGIQSINGDTTAAQVFVGAGGATVVTVAGVTTITAGSGGGGGLGQGNFPINTPITYSTPTSVGADDNTYFYGSLQGGAGGVQIFRYKITSGGLVLDPGNITTPVWFNSVLYQNISYNFASIGNLLYLWVEKIATATYMLISVDKTTQAIVELGVIGAAPAPASQNLVTTDGIDIFIADYGTTLINQYTVSPTDITFVAALTATTDTIDKIGSDHTFIYTHEVNGGANFIRKYDLTGALIDEYSTQSSNIYTGWFTQNGIFQATHFLAGGIPWVIPFLPNQGGVPTAINQTLEAESTYTTSLGGGANDNTYVWLKQGVAGSINIFRYKIANGGMTIDSASAANELYIVDTNYEQGGGNNIASIGNKLYVWCQDVATTTPQLVEVDKTTGVFTGMTIVGLAPIANSVNPVTTDGNLIYIADIGTTNINVYSLAGTTITYINSLTTTDNMEFLGSDGTYLYTSEDSAGSRVLRKYDLTGVFQKEQRNLIAAGESLYRAWFTQNGVFQTLRKIRNTQQFFAISPFNF